MTAIQTFDGLTVTRMLFFKFSSSSSAVCCNSDDHSRVVLEKIEEDVDSDYINACYIDVSN